MVFPLCPERDRLRLGPAEAVLRERQRADALTGGCEDRVADRGRNGRQRRLTKSGRRIVRFHEFHLAEFAKR